MEEIRLYSRRGSGDDFERSHQEAFLYQLIGVRDAFLQELNFYYQCGLTFQQVRPDSIRKCMQIRKQVCPELQILSALETEVGSWLNVAKEMRDHSTHRRSVPRTFDIGGDEHGKITLQDPRTKVHTPGDQIEVFSVWHHEMEDLIRRLRATAINEWESNNKMQQTR